MSERNGRKVEVRFDRLGRLRDRDMGMDIDGNALRPHLAPGLAVAARGGLVVLVPLLGHGGSLLVSKLKVYAGRARRAMMKGTAPAISPSSALIAVVLVNGPGACRLRGRPYSCANAAPRSSA